MRYGEGWTCQGSLIWHLREVTREQRPVRALVPFTLPRPTASMRRARLSGYSLRPAFSDWPAGFISTCFFVYLRTNYYQNSGKHSLSTRNMYMSVVGVPIAYPRELCVVSIDHRWGLDNCLSLRGFSQPPPSQLSNYQPLSWLQLEAYCKTGPLHLFWSLYFTSHPCVSACYPI